MKNKNNIITKIAVAQTFATHQVIIGEGFKSLSKTDLPYKSIDNTPVFLRGHNAFDLELYFNIRKVYKWGEYYDSCLIAGMPSVGGSIKLYIDTSVDGWYILWSATKLDAWMFDETSIPAEYTVLSWTVNKGKGIDSIERAGYRMFSAVTLNHDCVEGESWYCNWYEDDDYRNDNRASQRSEKVFASLRDTFYRDEEDLEVVVSSAPQYLKNHIRDRAKYKR